MFTKFRAPEIKMTDSSLMREDVNTEGTERIHQREHRVKLSRPASLRALCGKRFSIYCVFLLLAGPAARGQRTLDYDNVVVPQTRIDARGLGYPPLDVIPAGESAITALAVAPNGNLYGATSGKRSHLFVLNPTHGYVQPLGYLPGTTAVTNALVVSASGDIYIGSATTGHLLKYSPSGEEERPIRIQDPVAVSDLGVPVAGEGISALVIAPTGIYGLTSPNAHMFTLSIGAKRFTDLGVVATKIPPGEKFETQKVFSRMLAVDTRGTVYASGEDGFIYGYFLGSKEIGRLRLQLPVVPGREPWTRADTFLTDSSGLLYGGTSDGYLFRFDPEKMTVTNLGKPLPQYRITGMAWGPNGKI